MKKEEFEKLSVTKQTIIACSIKKNEPAVSFQIPVRYFPKTRACVKGESFDKQVLDVYYTLRKLCLGKEGEAMRDSTKKFNILVAFPRESWKDVCVVFQTLGTELEGIQPITLQRNGTFNVAIIYEEVGSVSGEIRCSVKRLGLQDLPL